MVINIIVDTPINPIIHLLTWSDISFVNVEINETDVYAAPTIDVRAAAQMTSPNTLYPKFPAASLKADAGGLAGSSTNPFETTPKTAKNNNTLIIAAIPIPIYADLFISSKFSSPEIPASISLCPPENVIYPPTVPPTKVIIASIGNSLGITVL